MLLVVSMHELAAMERAADERAGPRDTLRSASDGGDAPFKPRLGTPDGSPFCLSGGRARGHNRGHLGAISGGKSDLGAEGASEAVANDDTGWARRGQRPLPEHGDDRRINVSDGGPPTNHQ